jgi:glycosyltransferase involved in cell wall biosynthesis
MNAGGSQRQLLNLLERLDRSRFDPQLFLISPHGELLSDVPDDVTAHIAHRPGSARNILQSAFAARQRVDDLVKVLSEQRIDVVYDRTYHMTLITGAATRKFHVPRASVIVSDPLRDFETNPERLRWLKRRMLRKAYQRADAVVAVSEGVRRAAIDYYGLAPGQVETVWNSFDVERIQLQAREPLSAELARRPGRFRIVAAGRLHEAKGYDLLIQAVRQIVVERGLPQVELVIAGGGEQEQSLRTLIEQSQLADHVILAGHLPNPLPLIRSADLFCLSSRYEGMPNVVVEAMCCEVPVLATDCKSGPRDILQDRFGRLVQPNDVEGLAKGIVDIMSNPSVSRSIAPAALAHVSQAYGITAGVQHVEELLLRLARQSRA